MPLDQGCEGQLGRLAAPGREPFQELTVRQLPDGPQVEQGSELPPDGPVRSDRHEFTPRPARRYSSPLMIVMPLGVPADRTFPENGLRVASVMAITGLPEPYPFRRLHRFSFLPRPSQSVR